MNRLALAVALLGLALVFDLLFNLAVRPSISRANRPIRSVCRDI